MTKNEQIEMLKDRLWDIKMKTHMTAADWERYRIISAQIEALKNEQ